MRYLRMPTRESFESTLLAQSYGKHYVPTGSVSLAGSVELQDPGVQFVDLDGECLAIEPDTGSWAFLNPAEVRLYRDSVGHRFDRLQARWSPDVDTPPDDFVAQLFRRGLLRLDGAGSVDEHIFEDSPNTSEPHLVEMLLTEKCNLACGYCLAGTSPDMPSMKTETALRTVDLAFGMSEAESFTFEFAGGEPMMKYRLLQEVVEYIQQHPGRDGRDVQLALQTNCTLFDDERVKWIKRQGIHVGVSIDGNPRAHNKSRPMVSGGESFSKVEHGLELLRKHDVPFGLLVVLNRFNSQSAGDLLDFLDAFEIRSLKLNPIAYLGTARSSWDDFGLRPEQVTTYFQDLARLIVDRRAIVLEDNLRTMADYLMSKQRGTRCMRTHCGAGETFQTINASGRVFPCGRATQSPELAIGDVHTEPISLSAPGAKNRYIQEIKHRRPRDLEGCTTCEYRQFCQAGCSVQAFERYGTVRHRTPECDFYKQMYPFLLRWLTFDRDAVGHLAQAGYFGAGVEIVDTAMANVGRRP